MQYYTQQTQNLVESTYNLYVNAHGKRRLPDDFSPGPYDVICARGKAAHNAEGNVRFRALVQEHAAQYGAAECKYEKSKIVSHIVNTVRTAAAYHQGGFVKQSGLLWFEVGDRAAKEKIGQTFRDLLHTKYSSSTKAKARVRIQRRMGDDDDEDHSEERSVEHVVTKAVVQVCFIILSCINIVLIFSLVLRRHWGKLRRKQAEFWILFGIFKGVFWYSFQFSIGSTGGFLPVSGGIC